MKIKKLANNKGRDKLWIKIMLTNVSYTSKGGGSRN